MIIPLFRLDTELETLPRLRARGQAATQDQFKDIARIQSENWETIVPMSDLGEHRYQQYEIHKCNKLFPWSPTCSSMTLVEFIYRVGI